LTQSLVHASRDEIAERPGNASWCHWLRLLIGGASNVVDAACMSDYATGTVAYELHSTPSEMLELEARALLTSCLQALALFETPASA
jgi:hypothetical protein